MAAYYIVIKDWGVVLYDGVHWASTEQSAKSYGAFLAKLLYGDSYTDIIVRLNS